VLSEACTILVKAEELDTVKEGGDDRRTRSSAGRRTKQHSILRAVALIERTGSVEAFNRLSPRQIAGGVRQAACTRGHRGSGRPRRPAHGRLLLTAVARRHGRGAADGQAHIRADELG